MFPIKFDTNLIIFKFILTVYYLIFNSFVNVHGSSVLTIYNQTFQYGTFRTIPITGPCTNLPRKWQRETTAMDLHDNCFIFYSQLDCQGRRVILQPFHTKYLNNLDSIGFNDQIVSVKECGKRVAAGPYLVRSAADGSVLNLLPMKNDFYADTLMRPFNKFNLKQIWVVKKFGPRIGINYGILPLDYPYYNPVTYQTFELRANTSPYMPERYFDIKPLPNGKYLIKILHSSKCLINRGTGKPIGKTQCAAWQLQQQFNFIPIRITEDELIDGKETKAPRPVIHPITSLPILL